jgi:hypothetical protein
MNWQFELYRQKQADVAKIIYKSTCHFIKTDNGIPKSHGSGVFVEIENNYFVLTAGHVVDNCENDICIGLKSGNVVYKLGGEWITNKPKSDRDNDKLDAAIIKLDNNTIDLIGNHYHFINMDNIETNHEPRILNEYISLGFPSSMSKYNPYKKEGFKSKPFPYITKCAEDVVYKKLGYDKNVNIIVNYEKRDIINFFSGEHKTGPDLYGCSGSGLWYIPRNEALNTNNIPQKLVAIMTEWPTDNRKFLIGTRIDMFIQMIRNKWQLSIT